MELPYLLRSSPKGNVLIINNETFFKGEYEKRDGSERDYDNLRDLFNILGFRCRSYYNLNYTNFTRVIKSFALSDDHWNADCCIVFIMTHGHKDKVNPHAVDLTTTDNKFVSTDWIKEKFNSENCKALINKPKVLFFQACRDSGHAHMKVKRPTKKPMDDTTHHVSDLLLIHSCLPGYGAHRNSKYGAWFVQELCKVIKSNGHTSHLISMLYKVDMNLRKRFVKENGTCFQAVYFEKWSFNKLLFLSDEAYSFYKHLYSIKEAYQKKKYPMKPPASQPLQILKYELRKSLAGVITDKKVMEWRRRQVQKIPPEKRKIIYLNMK